MAEPKYVSCARLAEILATVSHDSVNRFLLCERYTPRELFNELQEELNLVGGTLSVYEKEEGKTKNDNELRYYIMILPALEDFQSVTREQFKQVHDDHWQIECFHRVIKQVWNIERFYVRDEHAIRNHFFCALRAFGKLQTLCIKGMINNCYEISRQLFVPVIRQFILSNLTEATFVGSY